VLRPFVAGAGVRLPFFAAIGQCIFVEKQAYCNLKKFPLRRLTPSPTFLRNYYVFGPPSQKLFLPVAYDNLNGSLVFFAFFLFFSVLCPFSNGPDVRPSYNLRQVTLPYRYGAYRYTLKIVIAPLLLQIIQP
jgi:hypothetical protein